MPGRDVKKSARRRRPSPIVELLEGRLLLSGTSVTKPVTGEFHAEVIKSTTDVAKQEKTGATKLAKQETAQATKLAKQEKAAAAKLAKQEKAAARPVKEVVLQKAKAIKVTNKLIDLDGIDGPSNAQPAGSGLANVTYLPVSGAFNPTQLETAYGLNQLPTSNQGQGETIAILEEGSNPNIVGDANFYSSYYNLPQFNTLGGPTLTIMNDSDLAAVGTAKAYGSGGEYALDVEMVHAMAPMANILMVNVPATGTNANAIKEIAEGIQFAANQAPTLTTPLVAISVSYGLTEAQIGTANVSSQNSTYLATGTATNFAITVSTGDGSTPGFPGDSPNVIGIGGTSLYLASARGRYSYETAWGGLAGAGAGGGGASTVFAAPTFQSANGVTLSTKRTIPDISLEADDVTAVSVYDSLDAGTGSPWTAYGGTSVAAPLAGGIIALAQQLRLAASMPILDSVDFNTAAYELYNSSAYTTYFHDVVLGNNSNVNSGGRTTVTGFSATTGYDEATGIGSPIGNLLVPYLGTYTIGT